jgi:glycine/D-amino acid oxidase-like deaminating enzyme
MQPKKIVVVGGGILGALVGYELAKRGQTVTIIEKESFGGLATSGSFAWITNQSAFRNAQNLPEPRARDYFDLHRLSHAAWHRLNRDFESSLPIQWNGTLHSAVPGTAEDQELHAELDRRQRWGSPSHFVAPARASEIEPNLTLGDESSVFYAPDEGSVDPVGAVLTLLGTARSLGAETREHEEVLTVERTSGTTTVETTKGTYDADIVLFACGVENPKVLQTVVDIPLVESEGSIVHLAPSPMLLRPVLLSSRIHAIQRNDGRIVLAQHFSGSPVGDPHTPDAEEIREMAATRIPGLQNVPIEHVTTRRRIVPQDGLPIFYNDTANTGVAAITTNAGISLGPILAQLITTELLDECRVERLDPYRIDRFDDPQENPESSRIFASTSIP